MTWLFILLGVVISILILFFVRTAYEYYRGEKEKMGYPDNATAFLDKYGRAPRGYISCATKAHKNSLNSAWLIRKLNTWKTITLVFQDELGGSFNSMDLLWKKHLYKLLTSLPIHNIPDLCIIYIDRKYKKLIDNLKPNKVPIDKNLLELLVTTERNGLSIVFEIGDKKSEDIIFAKKELRK